MIQINVLDGGNAQARRIPAEEVLVDGEPDQSVIEIDLTDEITIWMTEEDAEDLRNALDVALALSDKDR